MSDVVISARGLGKSYLIGHKIDRSSTFRDRIVDGARAIGRNLSRTLRGEQILAGDEVEEFWALRDVSFDIRQGDTVGIIGRNGAGKSTLLKILSRITEPTKGRVELRGRVSSLLEVGTGFHPELTGRENVLLNGAILGMTRKEIQSKFDEILAFAGVERFIDTPVKRYSSGMQVRLAFAVAAHLEPEILIVDEVLAVGDAEFQRKCLGKMKDVAGRGRTVLFVSHNVAAVESLCSSAFLIENGRLVKRGSTAEILAEYGRSVATIATADLADRVDRTGTGTLRASRLTLEDPSGASLERLRTGQPCVIALQINNATDHVITNAQVSLGVKTRQETRLSILNSSYAHGPLALMPGMNAVRFSIPRLSVSAGEYLLNLRIFDGADVADVVNDAAKIAIDQGDFYRSGKTPPSSDQTVLIDFAVTVGADEAVNA